jgi:Calcineurin-like phosphoesterase
MPRHPATEPENLQFGAIGDLHGDFASLDRIMTRHPNVAFWVCPGDLASEVGEYPRPRAPLYWIKGNNEDFDFVAAQPPGAGTIPNLFYIPNGIPVQAPGGITLAGLGGTFAPTWYDKPSAELRAARPGSVALDKRDDKRRHFVQQEVDACKQIEGVDVFLSHEAARPFLLPSRQKTGPSRPVDAGKTPVNEVLAAMRPRLHLFGHHHTYVEAVRQQVPSIGLEMASASYLIFDGRSLAHERRRSNP